METPKDGADLANFFLRSELSISARTGKGEKVQVVEATPEKFITDLPLVVLIDGSTAGAAEIAAGALKDHEAGDRCRGKIIWSGFCSENDPAEKRRGADSVDGEILHARRERSFRMRLCAMPG